MQMEETARGFSLAKFTDAAENECSIQDSSLASEAAIWFGVSKTPEGGDSTRMHLTRGMAILVATAIRGFAAGEARPLLTFSDRYGSHCTASVAREAEDLMRLGVSLDFNGNQCPPMELTREMAGQLMPPLLNFIASGSISTPASRTAEELLTPRTRPAMDVKIPPSMLERTDVGETGVSAQELIDAFCLLLEGSSDGEIAQMVGFDTAPRIAEMRSALRRHWRNEDGTPVIL